jgi:uroporphyrinogen-III synthase
MSAGVILLKAPSQDKRDPYRELFEFAGYAVGFVPVETAWNNLDKLKTILLYRESLPMYGGVIVTSARASEAWKTVLQGLTRESASSTKFEGKNILHSRGMIG